MEKFIENHQYNQVRDIMANVTKVIKYNDDKLMVDGIKDFAQDKIEAVFSELSGEKLDILQMRHLETLPEIEEFLVNLDGLSYGMTTLSDGQIHKLFRKEKKLKLPEKGIKDTRHTYLGWKDEGKKRLYLAMPVEGRLLGIAAQMNHSDITNNAMCALCDKINDRGDVISVTARCKGNSQDNYHAIGFNVCQDSRKCNEQITDPTKLVNLLKKVNGL